jgi:hypothetical protein
LENWGVQPGPQAILDAALKLPENDRLAIALRLWETLPDGDLSAGLDDPELTAELNRRFAENAGSVPWPELRAEG